MNSSRWAFMVRFDIPDSGGDLYLRRWRVIQTPLFALYVHKILRPDADRESHDHPWNFVPITILGGYTEEINGELRDRRRLRPRYMRAEKAHRIDHLWRVPTWTICLVGRRRRTWGFYTEKGWVPWDEFEGVAV